MKVPLIEVLSFSSILAVLNVTFKPWGAASTVTEIELEWEPLAAGVPSLTVTPIVNVPPVERLQDELSELR